MTGILMKMKEAQRKGRAHRSRSQATRYSSWATRILLVRASFEAAINAERSAQKIHALSMKNSKVFNACNQLK
jgi:hypothetical protein